MSGLEGGFSMAHVLIQPNVIHAQRGDKEAEELAQALGLTTQANLYRRGLAQNVFQALTKDKIRFWRRHCPTIYSESEICKEDRLHSYSFNAIPIEVMRHWKAIKEAHTFDWYQIWTTENARHHYADTLLIGVVERHLYLLARWGFESPEQISSEQIARKIIRKPNSKIFKHSAILFRR